MKATLWLCSLVTTILCMSQSVYCSPITDYRYLSSKDIHDNYLSPKRTKPSLSIVNPLDVLRQRLLLEIARRQMKENTKQVELNRQILKNVGKRANDLDYYEFERDLLQNNNDNFNLLKAINNNDNYNSNNFYHHQQRNNENLISNLNHNLMSTGHENNDFVRNLNNNNNKNQQPPLTHTTIYKTLNNNEIANENDENGDEIDDNDDYQLKYAYSLHKNNNNINNDNTNYSQ